MIPAAGFFLLYMRSHRKRVAITAASWLLYTVYEYGMKVRWLCSGECNIRVDLLLLYPMLLLASIVALIAGLRTVGGARSIT